MEKAYVSALMSELTYYRIPDFEIEDADRINLVPCNAFQSAAASFEELDFEEALRALDFGSFFVVERRFAVSVGIVTPSVIFVSIRGTKYLYDWVTNLGVDKFQHPSGAKFHGGFFRAIFSCFDPIQRELMNLVRNHREVPPIYVSGHSLGGAMAAIFNAVWRLRIGAEWLEEGKIVEHTLPPTACYTFGMPRYGDVTAISLLRAPFHFYNEADIVPTVPPTFLGFETCLSEYRLNGRSIENTKSREIEKFGQWMLLLASGQKVSEHSMELYRTRVGELIGV
jgi:hypothetical protein